MGSFCAGLPAVIVRTVVGLRACPRWIIAGWIVRRYLKPQVKRSPGRSAKMLAGRAGLAWP